MRNLYLGLSATILLFLWNTPSVAAQCPAVCDFDINMNFQSVNMTGNQTACFSADASDISFNFGGTNNTICVPAGITWTQNFGGTFSNVTIEVYGTVIVPGGMNFNNATVINVYSGGVFETSSTIAGPVTVNNAGTFNYLPGANGQIGGQNGTVFNNLAGGVFDATALTNQFLLIGPVALTNFGTMNFSSLENNEADVFDNYGEINISRFFFNHGNLYNYGDINTACGMFGAGACEFIVGNKGPDKKFVNNSCVSINGNVTFNGASEINGPFQVVDGDLTINFPVTGMDGGIFVTNGTSTITTAGSYVGTNLTICDENTPGNDFDADNGNNPSMYTVDCTDAADPCGAVAPPPLGDCNCTDYIYLNEVSGGGVVHKFNINPTDGTVTEVLNAGNPWYPGAGVSELPSPHGLGADINGNLYIGSDFNNATIRRLNCDGEISPAMDFSIGPIFSLFNISSYDGFIFSNGSGPTLYRWDPCDGSAQGTITLQGAVTEDWGLYIDASTGTFYATDQGGNVWKFTPTDADFLANTSFAPIITGDAMNFGLGNNFTSGTNLQGVTVDDIGNIYVVEGNRDVINTNSRILKFDPSGALLVIGPTDNNGTDVGGWNQMVGIVYSSASDRLYTSSLNQNEDCLASWASDLTDYRQEIGPIPGPGRAKGIAIRTECCPASTPLNLSETVCLDAASETVFLQDLIDCGAEGSICEGSWMEVANSSGNITFDDCRVSVTGTGVGCATYELSSDGSGATTTCGAFSITVEVCFATPPSSDPATSIAGTCMGMTPNNDATISIANIMNADVAGISSAGAMVYDGPAYGAANGMDLIDVSGGSFSLATFEHGQNYVIRLYNAGDGCYTDVTVSTASIDCSMTCTIDTDGLANVACTGNNAITFDLTPTGTGVSATYSVSVSGGSATSISPTSGTYGVTTSFTLNDASAGGGDVTVTITDANGCTRDVIITDPGICSCEEEAEAGTEQTICATTSLDLSTLGASITPAMLGGTWSTSGTGTFDDTNAETGVFGTATTYTPSAADIAAGQIILTLTSDDPGIPGCLAVSDEVIITILNVDCGTFPWDGQ